MPGPPPRPRPLHPAQFSKQTMQKPLISAEEADRLEAREAELGTLANMMSDPGVPIKSNKFGTNSRPKRNPW